MHTRTHKTTQTHQRCCCRLVPPLGQLHTHSGLAPFSRSRQTVLCSDARGQGQVRPVLPLSSARLAHSACHTAPGDPVVRLANTRDEARPSCMRLHQHTCYMFCQLHHVDAAAATEELLVLLPMRGEGCPPLSMAGTGGGRRTGGAEQHSCHSSSVGACHGHG